jgi:murein DD-endopeptidase MepM/ murein hydrolase activator NlpD
MRMLWRETAIAALLTGTLAACASPHYPIDASQAPGPAPLTPARPQYSIDPSSPDPGRAPAATAMSPTPSAAPDASASAPLAAPTAPVESQPLPAPAPSAAAGSRSGGARLQYASMTTQADAPPQPMSTTTTTLPPAAPAPAAPAPSPPPATSADDGLTPQQVVHDQTSTPAAPVAAPRRAAPVREAYVAPRSAREAPSAATNGQVIKASGDVFENYEVQRGDHIDALARAFSTTRTVILDANTSIRSPYLLHPGQILKVPVTKAYVAREGDTLGAVARRFSVNVEELAQINRVSARAPLQAGQQIGLPSSMRDRGAGEAEYADAGPYQPPPSREPPPSSSYASPTPATPAPERRVTQVLPAAEPYTPSPAQAPPRSTYIAPPGPPPPAASGYTDSEIAQAAHGRFVWPVRGDIVQRFGPQGVGRRNDGVDIKAAQGTVVKAAAQGEVVYAGDQVPGFGNLVLLKHADGWVTAYAHLDTVDVAMKQQVSQGQSLGSVGMTGGALQPELHFEVRYAPTPADKAKPVDPVLVLPMG